MVRLISRLLALLALLLAPLPTAAAAAPAVAVVAASAEHCDETAAASSHSEADEPQQDDDHPCCKDSMSNCCPHAAPLAGWGPPFRPEVTKPSHLASAEIFALGTARPPLTEPPTLA